MSRLCLLAALVAACSPAPAPAPALSPLRALQSLGRTCNNPLLAEALDVGRLAACDLPPAALQQPDRAALLCLAYLDVSRRLCAARAPGPASAPGPAPSASRLCDELGALSCSALPEYPAYEPTMRRLLSRPSRCAVLCASDDVLSEEPNYFCKALYWGTTFLKNVTVTANVTAAAHNVSALQDQTLNAPEVREDSNLRASTTDSSTPKTVPIADAQPLPLGDYPSKANPDTAKPLPSDPPITSAAKLLSDDKQQTVSNKPLVAPSELQSPAAVLPSVVQEPTGIKVQELSSQRSAAEVPTVKTEAKKVKTKVSEVAKFDESARPAPEIEQTRKPEPTKTASSVKVDVPEQANRPDADPLDDDYDNQDQNDDIDKSIVGQNPIDDQDKFVKKTEMQPARNPYLDDAVPEFSANMGRRDDSLEEEEDNFFPIFLSGVAMVALIYILYHNKNKVSKMVMGILIEGRQNGGGRRRNSRGHAYRRLDTLEQAISSSSTGAPPSKIIY